MRGSLLLSSIAERKCTKLKYTIMHYVHTHLRWCEQLLKHTFPQCAPANLETSCLLEIGDFLKNYGCVAVASFLRVPTPLFQLEVLFSIGHIFRVFLFHTLSSLLFSACSISTSYLQQSGRLICNWVLYYATTCQTETNTAHLTEGAMKLRNKLY
jgi:hypothetical protein